jgi:CubicO group peptidase (beta-lactamase class C family)
MNNRIITARLIPMFLVVASVTFQVAPSLAQSKDKKTENVEAKDTHANKDRPLKANESRSSRLTSKTADEYTVNVKENTFVFGAANQTSVDVMVSVHDMNGKKLAEFDGTGRGPEYFHFESDKAGLYTIKVAPFEDEVGDYEISLSRVEPIARKPEDRVDQLMSPYDNKTTPGGVVAVIKGGEVAFAKSYGMASLTYEIPFEVDTRTNIGSTSKQFTAYAILLLAQQNKLSLDDDFRKHIPELPDLGEVVTLRHALTHTTGYREFFNTIAMTGRRIDQGDWIDREEIVKIVQRQPKLQNSPGAEFSYNNTGFALLAEVVERVGKKPFPEWMSENVFQPLEMSDTFVRANPHTIIKRASMGYAPDKNGNYRESPDLGAAVGAGAIYTTIGDLAKWIKNYRTGELGGSEIFNQVSTPNKLTNGKATKYGFGLAIDEFEGQRRIHHNGADTAHRSMVMYFPELDAAVITQSNNATFARTIPDSVARAFFEKDLGKNESTKSEETETVGIDGEAFDKFVGRYELQEMAGVVLTFSRKDDTFFAQITGRPKSEITPTSPNSFKINDVGAVITFHPNEKGEMNTLTLKLGSGFTAKRIIADPWSPDAKQLAAYVGRYFSEELETFRHITIVDEKLVMKMSRREDAILSPTSENLFLSEEGAELKFQETEDGKFMELVVGNGRTRGVSFNRVDYGDTRKPENSSSEE